MRNPMLHGLAALLALAFSAGAAAQQPPLTRSLAEGQAPGEGVLTDLAWLAGVWTGPGIDGQPAFESYSPPAAGQIVGHFTQSGSDGPQFHELITFVQQGPTLVLRLKHFNPNLEGWETKDAASAVEFPLIGREGDSWFFDGLTIEKEGEDAMTVAVRVSQAGDELLFPYKRLH